MTSYKSVSFTKEQAQMIARGETVVTAEPVKKGEKFFLGEDIIVLHKGRFGCEGFKLKIISQVGEVRQVIVNGEKQWYCSRCKDVFEELEFMKSWHLIKCFGLTTKNEKKITWKPLLVRLEKIEREETPLLGGVKINKWLKTWVKE